MTFFVIFVEAVSNFGIVKAVVQYSSIVEKTDDVIHSGAVALLISSLARIVSAVKAHQYSAKRTDRTPEKRIATSKLFWIVTLISGVVMFAAIHLLNEHAEKTVKMFSQSENSILGSNDFIIRMTDSIADRQSTIFWTFSLHLILHAFTARLNKIERDLPRTVDIHAAKAVPTKSE